MEPSITSTVSCATAAGVATRDGSLTAYKAPLPQPRPRRCVGAVSDDTRLTDRGEKYGPCVQLRLVPAGQDTDKDGREGMPGGIRRRGPLLRQTRCDNGGGEYMMMTLI